jgi:hypothetical protein
MKHSITSVMLLLLSVLTVRAQVNISLIQRLNDSLEKTPLFEPTRRYIDSLHRATSDSKNLMTSPALDIFMAKKVNTYLTGTGDLALNKSYFILDPTDGRLFLGMNYAKDPSEGNGRTKWVFTGGIKADADESFSKLYDGENNKLEGNFGASLKITLLGRGIITYAKESAKEKVQVLLPKASDIPQYDKAEAGHFLRLHLKRKIKMAMEKDSLEFVMEKDSLEFVNTHPDAKDKALTWRIERRLKFMESQNKEYRKAFINGEADLIEEEGLFNTFWNHWVSFDLYLPFTRRAFDVGSDFSQPVQARKLYNLEATLLYNQIKEYRHMRWLWSLGFGAKNQNNITTTQLDKYSMGEYRDLGGQDTIKLAQLKTSDVYIGEYRDFVSPFAKGQLVNFFLFKKSVGLSLYAEKYFLTYDPLNVKVGVPFNLKGKDEETKVNFELQFKWNDVGDDILPEKSLSEKMVVGISIGVPLTGTLY